MKIIFWNIRGLANPKSKQKLANLCIHYRQEMVEIAEPMTDFQNIPDSYWRLRNLSLVACTTNPTSKLWVLKANSESIDDAIATGDQHVSISATLDGIRCNYSFVYASTYYGTRPCLWDDLLTIKDNRDGPWLFAGDFNATLVLTSSEAGVYWVLYHVLIFRIFLMIVVSFMSILRVYSTPGLIVVLLAILNAGWTGCFVILPG